MDCFFFWVFCFCALGGWRLVADMLLVAFARSHLSKITRSNLHAQTDSTLFFCCYFSYCLFFSSFWQRPTRQNIQLGWLYDCMWYAWLPYAVSKMNKNPRIFVFKVWYMQIINIKIWDGGVASAKHMRFTWIRETCCWNALLLTNINMVIHSSLHMWGPHHATQFINVFYQTLSLFVHSIIIPKETIEIC